VQATWPARRYSSPRRTMDRIYINPLDVEQLGVRVNPIYKLCVFLHYRLSSAVWPVQAGPKRQRTRWRWSYIHLYLKIDLWRSRCRVICIWSYYIQIYININMYRDRCIYGFLDCRWSCTIVGCKITWRENSLISRGIGDFSIYPARACIFSGKPV